MEIPLLDLQAQYHTIKNDIDNAIHKILDNSHYILGEAVSDFEVEFAKSHECKHCIGVGSGTDALHLALWVEGIGRGDEVITVPFTFIATVEAISLVGAKPVFVDIDPSTYTLNPLNLKQAITSKTKAVIVVHLYGQTAEMDAIAEICKKHNLLLIEDAAQAHLAKYKTHFVGHFGATTCFSFYPGKNLGAYGEAGAVLTNDPIRAEKIRQLRDHGQTRKYEHKTWGHNYRMDGFQGAVLGVKLKHLQQWTDRKREISDYYRKHLSNIRDLVIPYERPNSYHVYHQFIIRSTRRDDLQKYLNSQGIATGLHYPISLHMQPAYLHLGYIKGDFPVSEQVASECLSLPIYPEMTENQLIFIIQHVQNFFSKS
ncbi:MAG: DegT/DnrJ/EryC1/StrS family aminotransferase [Bacteroidota bacterium]